MQSPASTLGRPLDPSAVQYDGIVYDVSQRSSLLDWFRFEDRRVLDVGCGSGVYAEELKTKGAEVHGVTLSDQEQELARAKMERVVLANVETWEPDYADGFFDAILLSHILEHLVDPAATLKKLRTKLRPGGRVYVALPNIAYWRYRLRALQGRFDYESMGPMDHRHLRFYTFKSAQELVSAAGFEVLRAEVSGHLPLGPLRRLFPAMARLLDRLVRLRFPGLFGYEILLSATVTVPQPA